MVDNTPPANRFDWRRIVGCNGEGERYRLAMLRLGATDEDFRMCGIAPPTAQERQQVHDEGL